MSPVTIIASIIASIIVDSQLLPHGCGLAVGVQSKLFIRNMSI